jgi:predicted permease
MERILVLMSRIGSLFRRKELDVRLDEELRAHVDLAIAENMRRGMAPEEARTAALREFGGVTQTRERYRVQRGLPWVEQIVRDVRFAMRQLRKSPGFTLTAILTLTLGLGANTAVFSLINALLLRPLPVPHADELVVLRADSDDDGKYGPNYNSAAPLARALEKRHDVFDSVAAYTGMSRFQVRGASGSANVPGSIVSGQYFSVMETQPLMGRYLTPQDDQPGGGPGGYAVVISENFWRTWFSGAPDVLGRKLVIANAPFTVVGVMPKSFIGAAPTARPQIYAPMWAEPVIDAPSDSIAGGMHSWWLTVIARRKASVSLEQTNVALSAVSGRIVDEVAADKTAGDWTTDARKHHLHFVAEPGAKGYTYLREMFVKPLVAVFCLCGAMLLLACLNLASLLMARAAARERELATRLAMGATRGRLVQQLMVESLLIALLGTAAGVSAAPFVSGLLARMILPSYPGMPLVLDTTLDVRVLFFVALIAIVTTALIGLIPALRATSKNLNEQIKSGSNATTARESTRLLPRVLMGLEVALALMLVIGAGLLATSLTRLYTTGLGFEPKGIVNVNFEMDKQSLDGDTLVRWYQQFGDVLKRQPGVTSVSFASIPPMSGETWDSDLHTPSSSGDRDVYMNAVSPDYFLTMHIPILAGRDFQWNETKASGLKIVLSQSAAKIFFPNGSAVGQTVTGWKGSTYAGATYEVIAVVGDTRYRSIQEDPPAEGYVAITQSEEHKPSYTTVIRSAAPTAPLAAAVHALVARMAPDIPAPVMTTMDSTIDASIGAERMMATLAVFFAVSALLVTGIGLYGTLAYATARRTSEIGIRIALGAQRVKVVTMIFRENAWVAICGSALGLGIALFASRVLASFLYNTSVRDPWVLVGSVAALTLIASAASLIPAIRAASVDPIKALRAD